MQNANYDFVSVLIPNYNGRDLIEPCLRSVLNSNYPSFEVIVVDDCSTDNSIDIIKSIKDERIRLFSTKKNSGPAIVVNYGLEFCKGKYIMLLGNDNEVDPDWILESVRILEKEPSIGAVLCKIFELRTKNILQLAGLKLIPYTAWGYPVGAGEEDKGQFDNNDIIWATTNGLMVRREIFYTVGKIDEKLYHYSEDLDFTLRILLSGYRIVLSPKSKVYHLTKPPTMRQIITGKKTSTIVFHLTKNSLRTMLKNYSSSSLARYLPWFILVNAFRILKFLLSGQTEYAGAVFNSITWNLKNISNTMTERKNVQHIRRISDRELFSKISANSGLLSLYYKSTKKAVS